MLQYKCILSHFLRHYDQDVGVLHKYLKHLIQLYLALECIHAFTIYSMQRRSHFVQLQVFIYVKNAIIVCQFIQDSTSFFFGWFYTVGEVELVMMAKISSRYKYISRLPSSSSFQICMLETLGAH